LCDTITLGTCTRRFQCVAGTTDQPSRGPMCTDTVVIDTSGRLSKPMGLQAM
jgi:hypothetical protein